MNFVFLLIINSNGNKKAFYLAFESYAFSDQISISTMKNNKRLSFIKQNIMSQKITEN